MKSSWFKTALPHILAIAAFFFIALIYCQPAIQGKVLEQHDITGWKGMAQQSFEFKEKYGHFPLWTNSMFGGMPAYTIAYDGPPVQTIFLQNVITLGLPVPISFFFLACIAFYFMCLVFRVNPYISAMAAIAYAYATFDPIIIAVGHNTQMMAIAYAPAVIGSLILIYQRKFLPGAALLALFFGLQISTQHVQVVYYTCIIMGLVSIACFINSLKEKELPKVLPAFGIALLAALVGLGTYAVTWMPLQEYSHETMRGGKSELTAADSTNKSKGGLNKDYAFFYGSYGIAETFSVFTPGIYGGGSAAKSFKPGKSAFANKLTEAGVPEESAIQFANSYAYWGNQPGHAGPVYFGAIICFLFIMALVFIRSWHKWWILSAVILAVFLSWGKNFSTFNYFIFDYLPLYNKFRAPSMSLVIPQLCFPLLAALGLQELVTSNLAKEEAWKRFKKGLYITGGVFALLIAFYFTADFTGPNDAALKEQLSGMMLSGAQGNPTPQLQQQAASFSQSTVHSLQDDRKDLFTGDLVRSFILIAIAALLVGAYLKEKINQQILLIGLLVACSFDLLGVASRYLNADNYVDKDIAETSFQPTAADLEILKDTNKPFRVFDQIDNQGPFNGSRASYFHNSVGGYSPAKLSLYNDLIEKQLSKGNMQVFNMLNTRYFIGSNPANNQPVAQLNAAAYGPAWLVKSIKFVKNADEEMQALDSTNLKEIAVIQQKYAEVAGQSPAFDSTASIQWVENLNDKVTYKTAAASNQFAVFSEIYYDKGWNAYVDGQLKPYAKVNYVLRGMPVPAGSHTIEFRFEPSSVATSRTITTICAILVYLLLLVAGWQVWQQRKKA
ncbi:YfhO family protein [Flavihumibacter profundi]|uniref:YfhO family protein n=1 Tax=Flavihumibacter profundi TaxID=2716883 RepID=UPI001CC7B257|nr:YfhO family protein [Flavihumibacter profundi]MBZ5856364.1 YfhO family protein [Flavihumibacter profundi]